MKRYFLLKILILSCFYVAGQTNDVKDSVIIGPKKYVSEVIQIIKRYDTSQSVATSRVSLDRELSELKSVLQKFIKVRRVSAFNEVHDNKHRETSYFVFFESENVLHRNLSVKWTVRK